MAMVLRRAGLAVGSVALVVAAATASHFGGEFSDMPALGLSTPVPNIIAKLGRRNDRVLLAPYHHLAYCNLPKAASSTVTTYMTGLNVNIHKFSDVEQFIIDRGGDSHFAMTQYSTFHEAGLEHWRNSSAPQYRAHERRRPNERGPDAVEGRGRVSDGLGRRGGDATGAR